MSDEYKSTNKLPENPYPERSHLLLEGTIDFETTEYSAMGGSAGFYIASKGLNLTRLLKLGDRLKGFSPETLEAKVWHNEFSNSGGDLNDVMAPLPILLFSSYNSITPTRHARFYMNNVYITGMGESATYLQILDVRNALPTRKQSFSYKIYNTIYKFTDTL